MLTGLEELDVSHNQLRHLPPELRLLTHIHTLNLSHNQLTHLPPTVGMASLVLGNLVHMKTLDVSDNKLVFLPFDLAKCSSLTALHVAGNRLQHPAMQRAQLPSLATLKVVIEEVSGINYVNAMNQKARTHGNPLCSVALGGGTSGCVEQVQHTACKIETDNPFFKQGFTLVVRDYSKDVEVRLFSTPQPSHVKKPTTHSLFLPPLLSPSLILSLSLSFFAFSLVSLARLHVGGANVQQGGRDHTPTLTRQQTHSHIQTHTHVHTHVHTHSLCFSLSLSLSLSLFSLSRCLFSLSLSLSLLSSLTPSLFFPLSSSGDRCDY